MKVRKILVLCGGLLVLTFGEAVAQKAKSKVEFEQMYRKSTSGGSRQPVTKLFASTKDDALLKQYIRWLMAFRPNQSYKLQVYNLLMQRKKHSVLQEAFFAPHLDQLNTDQWRRYYWGLFELQSEYDKLSKSIIEYYVGAKANVGGISQSDLKRMLNMVEKIQLRGNANVFMAALHAEGRLTAVEKSAFRIGLYNKSDLPKAYKEWLAAPALDALTKELPIVKEVRSVPRQRDLLNSLYDKGEYLAYLNLVEHWGWEKPTNPNHSVVRYHLQRIAVLTGHNPFNLDLPYLELTQNSAILLNKWFGEGNYIEIVNRFHSTPLKKETRFLIAAMQLHHNPDNYKPSSPEGLANHAKAVEQAGIIHKTSRLRNPYIWLDALRRQDKDFFKPYYELQDATELTEKQILFRALLQNGEVDLGQLVDLYSKIIFQDEGFQQGFEAERSKLAPILRDYLVYWVIEDLHDLGKASDLKTFYNKHISLVKHPPVLQKSMYLYAKSILYTEPEKARKLMREILVRFPKTHLRFLIENEISKIL